MSSLLAFALDASLLFPFSIFGAVAAVAWLLLDKLSNREGRAEERLAELRDPRSRRSGALEKAKERGGMARMFENAAPALAKPLTPKNEKDANKLKMKLAHAGFRTEAASQVFLGLKIVSLLVGLSFGGGFVVLTNAFDMWGAMKALFFAGLMFYLPELGLTLMARGRKEKIFLGLPDALDLLVVCVEAGLGLDQPLRKVAQEKKSHRVIAEEFGLCNLQLQMGRARTEVLQDLGLRNGVDDLRSLASVLIQADKFGSSIAQALRTQSDAMRVRRRQIAEEKAAKTAVKLIFPLVIFIFPGIFVVLVGPAAITMVRELFPKMGG